jgi:hypothetical protein
MRFSAIVTLIVALTLAPSYAQTPDSELQVYAAGVLNLSPFGRRLSGYGVYLGQDAVITAAHVVGRWTLLENPTISIAGGQVPAQIIKKGSFPQLDLALLVVDDAALPISLRLRRNPLCKTPPGIGANVVVVSTDSVERTKIVPPVAIAPEYRALFGSLVSEPHVSGSGVFDPDRKCLVGIMNAAVQMRGNFRMEAQAGPLVRASAHSVGSFVPAAVIANFIPDHLKF